MLSWRPGSNSSRLRLIIVNRSSPRQKGLFAPVMFISLLFSIGLVKLLQTIGQINLYGSYTSYSIGTDFFKHFPALYTNEFVRIMKRQKSLENANQPVLQTKLKRSSINYLTYLFNYLFVICNGKKFLFHKLRCSNFDLKLFIFLVIQK